MKKIIFIILYCSFFNFNSYPQNISIQSLGSGVDLLPTFQRGFVKQLYTDTIDNVLYATGNFISIGGKKCYGIAKWDGQTWDSLGSGIKEFDFFDGIQNVNDVVRYKNEIYICGAFLKCGRKNIIGIARWNGTEWNNVGGLLNYASIGNLPSGAKMEVYNNELYFIGSFTSIGNVNSNGIAKWNGNNWTDLSQNFPSNCDLFISRSIIHFNGDLHIAGNINCSTGAEERLLKKVGNQWINVGPGFEGDCWINKLTIFQNNLYIGGYFFTQSGNVDNSLAYTDGISYFPTSGGVLPSNLYNMFDYNNELYVGGQINFAGFQPVNRIAKWDGVQWINTGLSIENPQTVNGLLGSFAEYNGKLVVGGQFTSINGTTVYNIASVDFTSGIPNQKPNSIFRIYPNPTNTTFTVQAKDLAQLKSIQVFNALGQLVYTQRAEIENTIDVSGFSKGLYMVEVRTDKGVAREKLMVE